MGYPRYEYRKQKIYAMQYVKDAEIIEFIQCFYGSPELARNKPSSNDHDNGKGLILRLKKDYYYPSVVQFQDINVPRYHYVVITQGRRTTCEVFEPTVFHELFGQADGVRNESTLRDD